MNNIKKFLSNDYVQFAIVIISLLPLLSLNITDSHDWGGDFAQYIQQAINIVEGKGQNDTFYIFNPYNPYLAPPAYPVGFPLLLSPIYLMFGNSIMIFSIYLSAFFIGFLVLIYVYLKKYFGYVIALVATLLLAYNPHMIITKNEIIADIPFSLFFLSSVLYYQRIKIKPCWWKLVLLGALISLTLIIRSIGFVLLIAILVEQLFEWYKSEKRSSNLLKSKMKTVGIIAISTIGVYVIVARMIFPIENDHFQFYSTLFSFQNLGDTYLMTSEYYIRIFQDFFHYENGDWGFAPLITKAFALVFLLIGFFVQSIKKFSITEILTLGYLLLIFTFPNTSQGYRYLLPVFPFFLCYIISGFKSIKIDASINPKYVALFVLLVVSLQYSYGIRKITKDSSSKHGPQHLSSKYTFEYIKNNTPEDAVFIFEKPRVLGLYGQRYCYNVNSNDLVNDVPKQISELGFDYILITNDFLNVSLLNYIDHNSSSLELVYDRGLSKLYKRKAINDSDGEL